MRLSDEEISKLSPEWLPEDSSWSAISRRELAYLIIDIRDARRALRAILRDATGEHWEDRAYQLQSIAKKCRDALGPTKDKCPACGNPQRNDGAAYCSSCLETRGA
jgi:hypothetical protein